MPSSYENISENLVAWKKRGNGLKNRNYKMPWRNIPCTWIEKLFPFGFVFTCSKSWKQHLHNHQQANNWKNSRLAASLLQNNKQTFTGTYTLRGPQLLPSSTLRTTWTSGITTVNLTYYYPHGLQILPPSTLHYYPHGLQVLPPSALHYSPYGLQVLPPSALHYYPHRLQVLPPSAIQPIQPTVYPNVIYWCDLVFVQLWDNAFSL